MRTTMYSDTITRIHVFTDIDPYNEIFLFISHNTWLGESQSVDDMQSVDITVFKEAIDVGDVDKLTLRTQAILRNIQKHRDYNKAERICFS